MSEMSRRGLFVAGAGALAMGACAESAARAPVASVASLPATNQDIIRRWYAAWEQTDWAPLEALMTDDFTFSSAAGDDHISKSTYKAQCWESQKGRIAKADLDQVSGSDEYAFVKYTCHTKSGKTFRNIEYFRFREQKVASLECFFGDATTGYPSVTEKKG